MTMSSSILIFLFLVITLIFLPETNASYAIVTGASSGIGKSLATEAAKRGYDVVLAARRKSTLTELANEIKQLYKVDAIISVVDLTTNEGINTLRKETSKLDISTIFINAGFAYSGFVTSQPQENIENMIDLNIKSTTILSNLYASDFKAKGSGKILITSSFSPINLCQQFFLFCHQ